MKSKNVIAIDGTSFEHEVLGSEEPFLLDLTASWCGPCRALAPVIESIADAHAGTIRVGTLDVDASPDVARRLGIRGVPTVVAFRGGREIGRHTGVASRAKLLALVQEPGTNERRASACASTSA